MLTAGTAGIAAHNYSQVHQFPFRAAYDDYYDRAVDIGEVGVPEFADTVQGLLVDYTSIQAKYGDTPADWCLQETKRAATRSSLQRSSGRGEGKH